MKVSPGGSKHEGLLGNTALLEVPETAVYMVYLTVFIDNLAGSISTPMMPYYAKSFHIPTASIGWLYGAWSFSSTVFAPVLSRSADTFGRRPVLLLSLVGAGLANLIQGFAQEISLLLGLLSPFQIFVFGRFFSGVWAAVGSTCNVYITDVAPESIRAGYLSKLAMVPLLAILFGPGLGGGLAKFGLNVPITVDACITLFSAMLVSMYLPETPAFLRLPARDARGASKEADPDAVAKVPIAVHILGFTNFLGGAVFGTLLSTFAIFMLENYNFDALHVGFSFVGNAVVMVLTNIWVVPRLQKKFTKFTVPAIGGIIGGVAYISFAYAPTVPLTHTLPLTLFFFFAASGGLSIRNATNTLLVSTFTEASNRGKIFGFIQLYTNCGRMVGPIVATHIAQINPSLPFAYAGGILLFASMIVFCLGRSQGSEPKPDPKALRTKKTSYGAEWEDEAGSPEDVQALGRYVAELLSKRHYKWVSRRAEIETLLDQLLPELETSDPEAYKVSLLSIEDSHVQTPAARG